jgi:hypothetical protein
MAEALKPILKFRKYKVYDNGAIREFYLILRAAIKGAKAIGRVELLTNDQTVPKIMRKMPFADWKERASRRPEWAHEELGAAFEIFVERKWRDALNVAVIESSGWDASGSRQKNPAGEAPFQKGSSRESTGQEGHQGRRGG